MHLALVGINHKTASVEVREKVAFGKERIARALATISTSKDIAECVILSTCNRTEIYGVFEDHKVGGELMRGFVAEYNQLCTADVDPFLYQLNDIEVVEHLFRVVSGIDSMVVGESQIAAQVKEAYSLATSARTNGVLTNKLFHMAFRVGKKIRSKTGIGEGMVSVSHVATHFAQKALDGLEGRRVLLMGAGETGQLTARHLRDHGSHKLTIVNRTAERARELAKEHHAETRDFAELAEAIADADVVISATASEKTVISFETVQQAVQGREIPLVLIDLAVPRDIDPEVATLPGVRLFDMDALQAEVEANATARSSEAHKAKRMIRREAEKFMKWARELDATPMIIELQHHFEHIRQHELSELRGKLADDQFELVEAATRAMMNKLLHHPIVSVRHAAGEGDGEQVIRTIRTVLGLGKDERCRE